MKAQGNTLGARVEKTGALKGRNCGARNRRRSLSRNPVADINGLKNGDRLSRQIVPPL